MWLEHVSGRYKQASTFHEQLEYKSVICIRGACKLNLSGSFALLFLCSLHPWIHRLGGDISSAINHLSLHYYSLKSHRLVPEKSPAATDFKKCRAQLKQRLDHYQQIVQRSLQDPTWSPGDSPPPPAAAPDLPSQPYLREDHKAAARYASLRHKGRNRDIVFTDSTTRWVLTRDDWDVCNHHEVICISEAQWDSVFQYPSNWGLSCSGDNNCCN